jgi:hypothetical protein
MFVKQFSQTLQFAERLRWPITGGVPSTKLNGADGLTPDPLPFERRENLNMRDKILLGFATASSVVAGSYSLYLGVMLLFFIPDIAPSSLAVRFAPFFYLFVAFALDFDLAYILTRGKSSRRFIAALLVILATSAVGATLTSLLIWRGHWFALIQSR